MSIRKFGRIDFPLDHEILYLDSLKEITEKIQAMIRRSAADIIRSYQGRDYASQLHFRDAAKGPFKLCKALLARLLSQSRFPLAVLIGSITIHLR
ncbi:hypothetical protein IAQ61_009964 [Plenodomus lingam]|uniref:uncharacterized protein n=1 Tax=Leptosphaeria maculans TaxID=5022 RepID=UPI0033274173|nr:hypothetical protein IAQ61_009964 [Plenodomus lingam]